MDSQIKTEADMGRQIRYAQRLAESQGLEFRPGIGVFWNGFLVYGCIESHYAEAFIIGWTKGRHEV